MSMMIVWLTRAIIDRFFEWCSMMVRSLIAYCWMMLMMRSLIAYFWMIVMMRSLIACLWITLMMRLLIAYFWQRARSEPKISGLALCLSTRCPTITSNEIKIVSSARASDYNGGLYGLDADTCLDSRISRQDTRFQEIRAVCHRFVASAKQQFAVRTNTF